MSRYSLTSCDQHHPRPQQDLECSITRNPSVSLPSRFPRCVLGVLLVLTVHHGFVFPVLELPISAILQHILVLLGEASFTQQISCDARAVLHHHGSVLVSPLPPSPAFIRAGTSCCVCCYLSSF